LEKWADHREDKADRQVGVNSNRLLQERRNSLGRSIILAAQSTHSHTHRGQQPTGVIISTSLTMPCNHGQIHRLSYKCKDWEGKKIDTPLSRWVNKCKLAVQQGGKGASKNKTILLNIIT
jgi:hypothetical protein